MEYYISDSVREAVKRYNSSYDVVPVNDRTGSIPEPLMIAKKIQVLNEVAPGVMAVKTDWFPQLYIDQADYFDKRWLATLENAKIDKIRALVLEDSVASRHASDIKEAEAMAEAEADELYYYFRKQYSGYNWSIIDEKDPYAETKRMQDRLGRELR